MPRPALLAISALGLAIAVYAAAASPNAQPADASFHLMRVHAVMRGANSDTHIQYVELRMASGGQTQVSGHDVCFFDPSGDPWARFTFPANASSGAAGSSILIGSPSMDALWPHAPDFIFGPGNTVGFDLSADPENPVGEAFGALKVAFGSDSATVPADMCGAQFDVIDSVAYGAAYSGPVDFGTKLASDAPVAGQFAVKLTGALCNPCARDNSVDYSLVDVTDPANYPRNNAGQSAPIGDGTPSPTPVLGPAQIECEGPPGGVISDGVGTITATLTAPGGAPALAGEEVLWTDAPGLFSVTQASDVTDANGVATTHYGVPADAGMEGDETVTATFEGNAQYGGASCDVTFHVVSSHLPTPTSRPLKQGDVNCDDAVTAVDALFILRAVAQIPPPAACLDVAGDVNCDGARTAVDALGVLRFVAGLPVNQREPCPDIGTPV